MMIPADKPGSDPRPLLEVQLVIIYIRSKVQLLVITRIGRLHTTSTHFKDFQRRCKSIITLVTEFTNMLEASAPSFALLKDRVCPEFLRLRKLTMFRVRVF